MHLNEFDVLTGGRVWQLDKAQQDIVLGALGTLRVTALPFASHDLVECQAVGVLDRAGYYLRSPNQLAEEQEAAERKFKNDLARKWDLHFNNLFIFANMPLGRFADWLESSGNQDAYSEKLQTGFNASTLDGLMCRTLVSVAWDGSLYDCDFNQAANIPLGGKATHISDLDGFPERGTAIAVGEHCFACTAGSGFT